MAIYEVVLREGESYSRETFLISAASLRAAVEKVEKKTVKPSSWHYRWSVVSAQKLGKLAR